MTTPMTRILVAGSAFAMLCAVPVMAQQAAAAAGPREGILAADEPIPVLPTTGDGAAVVKLLDGVCKPMVEGRGEFETLTKAAGMTKDRSPEPVVYNMALSQRPYQISIRKPSSTNLTTCEMRIVYAPGWDRPIIDAMNVWRFLHAPKMFLERSDIGTYTDAERTTTTWDNWQNQGFDGVMVGLALIKVKKPDGTSATAGSEEALIQYSVRTPLPETVTAAREYRAAQAAAEARAKAQAAAQPAAQPAQVTPAAPAAPTPAG